MSTTRAYLIERPLTNEELEGFLVLVKQRENTIYLAFPNEALAQEGAIPWMGLKAEDKKAANAKLLNSLNALGHLKAGKDTVAAQFYYDGFPTWYYHKFRINFALQPHFYTVEQYRLLAQQYDQVVVYTHKLPDPILSRHLSRLVYVLDRTPARQEAVKPAGNHNMLPQLKLMGSRLLKGARQAFEQKKEMPQHLFVLNHAHLKDILDPAALPQTYKDNVFAGYFLREHSESFLLIDKLLIEKGKSAEGREEDGATAYYQRNLLYNEWIEATAILNPAILWKIRRYSKHLKKAYRRILKALKDPIHQAIMRDYAALHGSSIYFYYIYLAYRRFFKTHNFQSVSLLDEYSPNFRSIIDAASQEGVRTQAIQHGSLAATNPGYGYVAEDARFNPWPDRTLLWGNYWKELMIEIAAYPPERIMVTGQVRTDIIPRLLNTPLQAAAILGPQTAGKFLILFASQPMPDESLRRQAALDVFTIAKDLPDAWVVLKPHPREKDSTYYEKIALEAGCSNYSIHYNTDLFLQLRLCQVLVHCYSTVGIEAVYFGLPAIILDYLNQDVLRFAAEGVAMQALNAADLKQHLLAVQQGNYQMDEKKKQAYIQKYACAIDGKVSDRTAQALLSDTVAVS